MLELNHPKYGVLLLYVLRGCKTGPGRLHLLQHAGGEGLGHSQRGLEHNPRLLRSHPHREWPHVFILGFNSVTLLHMSLNTLSQPPDWFCLVHNLPCVLSSLFLFGSSLPPRRVCVWPCSSWPSSRRHFLLCPSPFSLAWSFTLPQTTWYGPSWTSWHCTSSTFSRTLPPTPPYLPSPN